MRPRTLRRALVATAAATVLTGTGIGFAADVHASPETDFLDLLNAGGVVIYDASRATEVGHQICAAMNFANGEAIAWDIYNTTTYFDVPTIDVARFWVVAAGSTLCPYHFRPERRVIA